MWKKNFLSSLKWEKKLGIFEVHLQLNYRKFLISWSRRVFQITLTFTTWLMVHSVPCALQLSTTSVQGGRKTCTRKDKKDIFVSIKKRRERIFYLEGKFPHIEKKFFKPESVLSMSLNEHLSNGNDFFQSFQFYFIVFYDLFLPLYSHSTVYGYDAQEEMNENLFLWFHYYHPMTLEH